MFSTSKRNYAFINFLQKRTLLKIIFWMKVWIWRDSSSFFRLHAFSCVWCMTNNARTVFCSGVLQNTVLIYLMMTKYDSLAGRSYSYDGYTQLLLCWWSHGYSNYSVTNWTNFLQIVTGFNTLYLKNVFSQCEKTLFRYRV